MDSIVHLAGAVALLLWGTYMVKTGMLRTFGYALRGWLEIILVNRLRGFAAGTGIAMLLQSSTATALLVAGLQGSGLVSTERALSCVLGADFGSALMTRLLSLDLRALSPVLIAVGVFCFLKKPASRLGQFGRVLLGLGLVMLSLELIASAVVPVRDSPAAAGFLAAVGAVPGACLLCGAVLAVACFSSLAAVIIASGFLQAGLFADPASGLWVVLGANLGSAFLALITTAGGTRVAQRAPLGNMVFRLAGVASGAVLLAAVPVCGAFFSGLPDGPIYFHVAFNAALGATGLFFTKPVAAWVDARLSERTEGPAPALRLMSEENLLSPDAALETARREIVRSAELLRREGAAVAPFIRGNPPEGEWMLLQDEGRALRARSEEIGRFLTALVQRSLSEDEITQWQALERANAIVQSASGLLETALAALVKGKCSANRFFPPRSEALILESQRHFERCLAHFERVLGAQRGEAGPEGARALEAEAEALRKSGRVCGEAALAQCLKMPEGDRAAGLMPLQVELLTLYGRLSELLLRPRPGSPAALQ
ncbi:Na/Pi symporter [Mesosutterella sp. OilRF-GAM-744-9]|uniref:Na/Pi symporter n=1 Tax=Mesosutterella porci TaxID=2915351 RepID=A0ABS9MQ80_9BURK|nr:Na/Pi symporter [Mesosutterella sp. oilRF-744-WT-GAM-9]MCG5030778.1 Na/Pi symporter [Mesosutterella sp. oilRF-744-WT-GAM-9]